MKNSSKYSLAVLATSAITFAGVAHGQVADVENARAVAGIPVNNIEANVGNYTLPELLKLSNGQPVKDAATWTTQRRPEIVKYYESEVYGKIPATAPKVTWEVVSSNRTDINGTPATVKQLVGHMGAGPDAPAINLTLYTPANATKPVPVIVGFQFGGPARGAPRGRGPATAPATPAGNGLTLTGNGTAAPASTQATTAATAAPATPAVTANTTVVAANTPANATVVPGAVARQGAGNNTLIGVNTSTGPTTNTPARGAVVGRGGPPIDKLLQNGIGYASLSKGDIETDIEGQARDPNVNIVRKLALAPGQTAPAADEWGAIAAWAWGLSRVEDYLETDKDVDAKRVAITGGSRLGKTVLWAGVNDPRIAMVIAVSGGEGGAALARRNYGETIAHLVEPTRYPYQFAANYQKYAAHPEEASMDTHMLVAAMAPRPLLLHVAANGDQWSDPKGEYLAGIAATPAYQLLGKKGLDRTPDQPMVTGELVGDDLAFYLNNGTHAQLNWDIAIQYMNQHFHPEKTN